VASSGVCVASSGVCISRNSSNPGDAQTSGSSRFAQLNKVQKGRESESVVANWLNRKGFEILDRNFYCLLGEIDIIALHRDKLYLVEVRSRSVSIDLAKSKKENSSTQKYIEELFGQILQSFTQSKRRKIMLAGNYFLNSPKGSGLRDKDRNILLMLVLRDSSNKSLLRGILLD
jgi:Holliday junction resolvase-like predicted endonuclease